MLPCGVDLEPLQPHPPRRGARAALGLDPDGPYLLFPADPARPEKRFDRAQQVAGERALLTLGASTPDACRCAINAANAVLVPSEREGFGLAALEALACDVPVLATPVGIAPEALAGVDGPLCAPFDAADLDPRAGSPASPRRPADRGPRPSAAVLRRREPRSG